MSEHLSMGSCTGFGRHGCQLLLEWNLAAPSELSEVSENDSHAETENDRCMGRGVEAERRSSEKTSGTLERAPIRETRTGVIPAVAAGRRQLPASHIDDHRLDLWSTTVPAVDI